MSNPTVKEINNALRVVQLKLKLGLIGNSKRKFDMGTTYSTYCSNGEDNHYCNSVGCIGGYAEVELGLPTYSLMETVEDEGTPLRKLFYPAGYGEGEDDDWNVLTSKKAVKAVENYLKGRSDPWKGVTKRNTNRQYLKDKGEF